MKKTKILTTFLLTFLLGCLTVFAYFSIQRQRGKTVINSDLDNLVNLVNANKDVKPQTIEKVAPIREDPEDEEEE